MYSYDKNWRNKYNNMYDPRIFKIENYHIDAQQKKEMKHCIREDLLTNFHMLSDPLKKNLADSIIVGEDKKPIICNKNLLNMVQQDKESSKPEMVPNRAEFRPIPSFTGIANFFSGVMNVITGAMSQLRPKSPQYFDCFDDPVQQAPPSPPSWHPANISVLNKSERDTHSKTQSNMNLDCKTAVAQCEDKINKVKILLASKPINTPKYKSRRPRKVFVDPKSVEEHFEDAFSSEDITNMSNESIVEHYSPYQNQNSELLEAAAPEIKVEGPIEKTGIVETVPDSFEDYSVRETKENLQIDNVATSNTSVDELSDTNLQLVSSCEDKLAKLKALMQNRNKTQSQPSPETMETQIDSKTDRKKHKKTMSNTKNKHYKNPNRGTDKRQRTRLKQSIQDDLLFAHEINHDDLSSLDNSPSVNSIDKLSNSDSLPGTPNTSREYFNEISGRFHSSSATESEDSFQIVFKDSPPETRLRRSSDCDSEDSFIVFEESPDSCYTSNDVFGDSDIEESASESDFSDDDDDSAMPSHDLSRTVGDLTKDSLYTQKEADEVDCAVRTLSEVKIGDIVKDEELELMNTGVLMTNAKKLLKKEQAPKKVRFSTAPPKVHVMCVWAFAAQQARVGHWETCALDRDRFKRRIADVDMAVSWVLKPQHRSRVMFQRFMPWWNAQRRKELAEKKAREEELKKQEELKLQKEEEALRLDNGNDVVDNGNANNDECVINGNSGNDECVSNGNAVEIQNTVTTENTNDKLKIDKDISVKVKCNGNLKIIPLNGKINGLNKAANNEILNT